MANYYVNNNAQSNGDHEVHRQGCHVMPTANVTYLGDFTHCQPAVAAAKCIHPRSDGCIHCCRECHTG